MQSTRWLTALAHPRLANLIFFPEALAEKMGCHHLNMNMWICALCGLWILDLSDCLSAPLGGHVLYFDTYLVNLCIWRYGNSTVAGSCLFFFLSTCSISFSKCPTWGEPDMVIINHRRIVTKQIQKISIGTYLIFQNLYFHSETVSSHIDLNMPLHEFHHLFSVFYHLVEIAGT